MTKKIKKDKITPRAERFCKLYATDKEFFGNGVQSYIKVYKPDQKKKNWYKTSCSATSQLLSNIKVCDRINELLDKNGLNDEFVDKQLLFLITQHSDFSNKLGAVKEFNKLKQRITEKIDHTSKGEKITGFNYIKNETNNNSSSKTGHGVGKATRQKN